MINMVIFQNKVDFRNQTYNNKFMLLYKYICDLCNVSFFSRHFERNTFCFRCNDTMKCEEIMKDD